MNESSKRILSQRLEELARASDSLREGIEHRNREAGIFKKYVRHNEDAIYDYCRFYTETKNAILTEQGELSFVVKRIAAMPDISFKTYNRSENRGRGFIELFFRGGSSVTLGPFREKLQTVSETCASLLFVMKNPQLFEADLNKKA